MQAQNSEITLARSTYNARTETVAEKPSFRTARKKRQFCIIPDDCIFEPNYESGKPVRWRIERADRKPFGIAGIWERTQKPGLPPWSMSMLTINADEHPLMRRFHKAGDEKRSVVILDDDDWDRWLEAKSESDVRAMLRLFEPELMTAREDPRCAKSANASLDFKSKTLPKIELLPSYANPKHTKLWCPIISIQLIYSKLPQRPARISLFHQSQ